MFIRSSIFILLITIFIPISFSASNKWSTYPNSPKRYKSEPKVPNLALEIPDNLESLNLNIIPGKTSGGKQEDAVPVYYEYEGILSFIGRIPVGNQVKILSVNAYNRIHYYEIEKPQNFIGDDKNKNANGNQRIKTIWIAGNFISVNN